MCVCEECANVCESKGEKLEMEKMILFVVLISFPITKDAVIFSPCCSCMASTLSTVIM